MPFILFIIFLSFASPILAATAPDLPRSKAIDTALSKIEAKKKNPKGWEEANADKPYIGLLSEYDVVLNEDWSYVENYHARVRIQKESAKELGQWPIYYNKSREEIVSIKAFIETVDGKKVEATKIEDQGVYDDLPMYADMKVKVITLPQVNVGTVIDVQVTTKVRRKEIPAQFWDIIPYPVIPTKYTRHTYVFPDNQPIPFHVSNSDVQPIVDKKDGTVKYSFVFEETEYADDEDFLPPLEEIAGTFSLSSIKDWKQVADWYRDTIDKDTLDDADISVKAVELAKDKPDQKSKAKAILEFIQDNFHYVSMSLGDHTVDIHPTVDVFKSHYGDCKDLAVLARQMLKIIGIDANICLFSGEFSGNPQNALPNLAGFDHMVLELSLDGQKYFVDPQAKGFDIGQLPGDYDNAYVFVIEPSGYRFDNLPIAPEETRAVISTSDISVSEDGSAIFEVHVHLPLEASQDFKSSWASTPKEDKDKFFANLEANYAEGGKMLDRQVKGLENRYGPVGFDLKYESPGAYPLVNDMILLKEAQQGNIPDFSDATRKFPIFVPNNSLIRNTNTYHLPDGLKVDFVPESYAFKLDMMEVNVNYTKGENNTITVDNLYRMKRAHLPVERYGEIKSVRDDLLKKNDQYIVLRKKNNLSPEAKDWVKKQ